MSNDIPIRDCEEVVQMADRFLTHQDNSDLTVSDKYFNFTKFDLSFIRRDNIGFTSVKPTHFNPDNKSAYVRRTFSLQGVMAIRQFINNLYKYLERYGDQNKIISTLHQTLMANTKARPNLGHFSMSFDFRIDINELVQHRAVYYRDLDLLIAVGPYNPNLVHPFSADGDGWSRYQTALEDKNVSGVFVEIVDNENSIAKRYMYLAKRIVEVPIRRDETRQSGVYFNVVESDHIDKGLIHPRLYSFEAAQDELGIYPTKEDAVTGGDPDKVFKAELLKITRDYELVKAETEKVKLENQRLKEEAEQRKIERDEEQRIRDEEFRMRELNRKDEFEAKSIERKDRSEVIKDTYETRSYQRKDRTEMIKLGGTALVTGLTMWALMRKKK